MHFLDCSIYSHVHLWRNDIHSTDVMYVTNTCYNTSSEEIQFYIPQNESIYFQKYSGIGILHVVLMT
jgi:hypothetical protein